MVSAAAVRTIKSIPCQEGQVEVKSKQSLNQQTSLEQSRLFEQAPFGNDDHIVRAQLDIVLQIGAGLERAVVEQEHCLGAVDLTPDLNALLGRKRPKSTGERDRL